MPKKKPLILVTNDDGIGSKGIAALVEVVKKIGTPIVVAPDSPQSGQGHAITITQPLSLTRRKLFGRTEAYECSGTPVDCVKLARDVILKNKHVDLCVSGINHGSNASTNILYSGTMSAAMEARLEKIDAIGFSLLSYDADADFKPSMHYAEQIIKGFLANRGSQKRLLNVNIPYLKKSKIKGVKICRQGKGRWIENYKKAKDPRGNAYYWLDGEFVAEEKSKDTDIWALKNNYISVVPSMFDLTDYPAIDALNHLEKL